AAHGVNTALVTGPDQELPAAAQERLGHRYLGPIREDEPRIAADGLDEGEDVVPAPEIESGRMIAQLLEEFLHLPGRPERLDQDRRPDTPPRQAEFLLRIDEDVVPQPR